MTGLGNALITKGENIGIAKGEARGEARALALMNALMADGRFDEAQRAANDPNELERLYQEYDLK